LRIELGFAGKYLTSSFYFFCSFFFLNNFFFKRF